jgi:hypothetical protein
MDRPQGMSEIEFDRAKRQGHYNQGHDEEEPDRGPDHPVSKTARATEKHKGPAGGRHAGGGDE